MRLLDRIRTANGANETHTQPSDACCKQSHVRKNDAALALKMPRATEESE